MSIGLTVQSAQQLPPPPSLAMRSRVAPRELAKLVLDAMAFAMALAIAYWLRFDGVPPPPYRSQFLWLLPLLPLVRLAVGWRTGTHRTSWRLFGLGETLVVLRSVAWVTGVLLVVRLVMPWASPGLPVMPLGVITLEALVGVTAVLAMRVGLRMHDEYGSRRLRAADGVGHRRRVLLVGAGRAGRMVARELRLRPDAGYEAVGFLDDDATRRGQLIEGVPVLGTTADASDVAARLGAQDIILTIPSASRPVMATIVERCRATGLPVQTVPGLFELVSGRVGITRFRPVRIEELLGRDVVELDAGATASVTATFHGRSVMVTGAGGSIGSELCRQLARLQPKCLILLERNENNLFDIEQEMKELGVPAIPCLADVADERQVELAFAEHQPQVVLHAAAYKHVPMMERHPCAAIANNVRGTRIVVDAAVRHAADRFLLVSTDKAVNPTNVMGASKRVAELIVHWRGAGSATRCCAVRFGNVLGSRGSVLHTFQRQIERGGPVTVTHEDVTRFFMTIPEAVRLVLQAGAACDGGETFLLDMGESVRILTMARQMIRLAGLTEQEVPIQIVGLRPGEKLHEELLRSEEDEQASGVAGIMLARGVQPDPRLRGRVAALEQAAVLRDDAAIHMLLATLTDYRAAPAASCPSRTADAPRRAAV